MRPLILVLMFVGACSSGHSDATSKAGRSVFQCYRQGGEWRQCAPKLERCADNGGCFERGEAYCFKYLLTAFGNYPEQHGLICTPTQKECDEWHEDRLHVENHAEGPCVLSRPDEYFEAH